MINFSDSFRTLAASLESLTQSLDESDFVYLKEEFFNHWQLSKKKLEYP